ncbi:MAG: shikimate dehydrogenase [Armatimonadetes bacterium]|nr:shikimate dehydrogenase [Armatimonadota bacterium]
MIDTGTRVVGVIGWPVEHSLSPAMHNAALAEMELNWVYLAFAVAPERVGAAVEAVRGLGLVGLNVTIPHKQAVVEYLDELDDAARALGAVNTIVRRDDRLMGHNTDGPGFLRSLEEKGHSVAGGSVVVIGAGGAARSVAYAVARAGASALSILNRTEARAEEVALLAREGAQDVPVNTGPLTGGEAERAVVEADVVVDCTSVGMYPNLDEGPVIPGEWLHEGQVVVDLTYNPRETTLLRAARRRGAAVVDGTGMLVHQGAISLQYWSGREAPVETMRRALLDALAQRQGQ